MIDPGTSAQQISRFYFVGILFSLSVSYRVISKNLYVLRLNNKWIVLSNDTGQILKIGQLKLESHFQSGARANSLEIASQQNMRQNLRISIGILY